MDIKNLITFIQVAELSSFTKAGQELGYSQSTISSQIKLLELELGCQLFERINHTVALTERGRELLDYAHRITRLVEEMVDDAKELTEIHGHIRLATADSLCSSLLGQPFILTEKGMSYRRLLDEHLAASSLEIQPVLELGRTDLICNLVEQGNGISFLPEYVIRDHLESGRLVLLPVEDVDIRVWKQLIHHRDKWISPQLKEVLQYCLEREF